MNLFKTKLILCSAILIILSSCGQQKEVKNIVQDQSAAPVNSTTATSVNVNLKDKDGNEIGKALLTQTKEGVEINLTASKLTPGLHGIHFHEKALCEPPGFTSAGGHFNPEKKDHGLMNAKGPHVGDLPNLSVDSTGKADMNFITRYATLEQGKTNSLLDADGSALVIHAKADDGHSNPAGNSGDRIACGEIK